jgi:hypothetical protein
MLVTLVEALELTLSPSFEPGCPAHDNLQIAWSARQLRASDRLAGAGWSGSERHCLGLATQIWLNRAALDAFPKLGVVGSSPIARS